MGYEYEHKNEYTNANVHDRPDYSMFIDTFTIININMQIIIMRRRHKTYKMIVVSLLAHAKLQMGFIFLSRSNKILRVMEMVKKLHCP